ncbi:hypothetical protein HJC99_04290 [Candidatus Saccharibacteria bacterium]|nr:hypothetical protein [Candidatus Saccharibacteria bacterium]
MATRLVRVIRTVGSKVYGLALAVAKLCYGVIVGGILNRRDRRNYRQMVRNRSVS